MKKILVHGSGHKATSWNEVISYMKDSKEILCPNLSEILGGKDPSYYNLYSSFAEYCNNFDEKINLCGLSLGGILALNYAIDFPNEVQTLILIGTPYKVPKVMFSIQSIIFKFFPNSVFENMAFNKKDTLVLGNSMKTLNFCNSVQKIKCPTLIICGKKDRANIKSANYLYENIKHAQLKIIEDTGHIVNEERPKELSKILNEYYREI